LSDFNGLWRHFRAALFYLSNMPFILPQMLAKARSGETSSARLPSSRQEHDCPAGCL
jgi:hypothetical protein